MSDRLIRALLAAAFVAGIGIFVIAVLVGGGEDDDVTVSNNAAIEALVPARFSEVLSQSEVALDLAPGFRGRFVAHNNRTLEDARTAFNEPLARAVLLLPDGLDPDENCVAAEYWPVSRPDEVSVISWCFTAA